MDFPDLILITMYVLIGGVIFFLAVSFWRKVIIRQSLKVEIIEGEVKGNDKDLNRLEIYGGPGQLTIHSGQIVVLQAQGKITREVGVGLVFLKNGEKIKAILPLTPISNIQQIDNVLTRDGISLNVRVLHVVQVESADDTRARLQTAVDDAELELQEKTITNISEGEIRAVAEKLSLAKQKLYEAKHKLYQLNDDIVIGDEYDQCYGSIARLVAMKAGGDIWQVMKHLVASNLRDAFMSVHSEELLSIGTVSDDLEVNVRQRKITEIEEYILQKSRPSGLTKGISLKVVDVSQIYFPVEIEEVLLRNRIQKDMVKEANQTSLIKAKLQDIHSQKVEQTNEMNVLANDKAETRINEIKRRYKKTLEIYYLNHARLKEKAAQFGSLDVPTKIQNEIKATEEEIEILLVKLEELERFPD